MKLFHKGGNDPFAQFCICSTLYTMLSRHAEYILNILFLLCLHPLNTLEVGVVTLVLISGFFQSLSRHLVNVYIHGLLAFIIIASVSFRGKMSCGVGDEGDPCISTIFSSSTEEFDTLSIL